MADTVERVTYSGVVAFLIKNRASSQMIISKWQTFWTGNGEYSLRVRKRSEEEGLPSDWPQMPYPTGGFPSAWGQTTGLWGLKLQRSIQSHENSLGRAPWDSSLIVFFSNFPGQLIWERLFLPTVLLASVLGTRWEVCTRRDDTIGKAH